MRLPTCSHINIVSNMWSFYLSFVFVTYALMRGDINIVSNMWSFYLSFIIVTYALMRGDARAREHIF
jgi:hypothetical protein